MEHLEVDEINQCWCVWGGWRKLPKITLVCKGIGECVGWSTAIILTWKELRIGSNKVHSWNMGSWICGFGDDQVTFKGLCILWRRRTCNHGLSFCAFSHYNRYCKACRITECGRNINGSTTRIGIRNSCNPKQIERHGVGKPIGTI